MILFKEINDDYGFFCNDYPETFAVGRLTFSSMTQYLMFCKARLFEDRETAWEICKAWDTRIIRDYGKIVKGFDENIWNGQRSIILARGLKAKFDQNPAFIADLIRTGEEMLVCCDPLDPEFGIGLWPSDPECLHPEQWKGLNLLGFALMELRAVYQAQMPEGEIREIREKAGIGSRLGLMEALDGQGIRMKDYSIRFKPYRGEEPYIYLNYSPGDFIDALRFVEFLNRQGFNVWYDEFIRDGRMWTAERSDAIERCFLVMDYDNGDKKVSEVRFLAREFAEILEIPVVDFVMPAELEDRKLLPQTVPALLEEAGLTPGMTWPEGEKQREPKWDLVLQYYEHYGEKYYRKPWDTNWRWVNMRTREVFDSKDRRIKGKVKPRLVRDRYVDRADEPVFLSDEELYRASGWKWKCYDAAPKSAAPDYIGTPKDWEFAGRLASLRGERIPEIEREYRAAKDRMDKDARDYPYMDEFEYISSGGGEES